MAPSCPYMLVDATSVLSLMCYLIGNSGQLMIWNTGPLMELDSLGCLSDDVLMRKKTLKEQ